MSDTPTFRIISTKEVIDEDEEVQLSHSWTDPSWR